MLIGRKLISKSNPDTDYLSLSEAKAWLRVTHTREDDLISMLITNAIAQVSNYLGYSVVKANTKYSFDYLEGSNAAISPFLGNAIPVGNYLFIPSRVISLVTAKYIDDSQTAQTLDIVNNAANSQSQFCYSLLVNSAPTSLTDARERFVIEVLEGFEPTEFPADIKLAYLLIIGQFYENRSNIIVGTVVDDIPKGTEYILDQYRAINFV
jgi:hypothetical protein